MAAIQLREIRYLLAKDVRLELRQQFALYASGLYVGLAVFIVGLVFGGSASPKVWIVVFWLLVLFSSLQSALKSFAGESEEQQRYLYQLVSPESVVISKLIFNVLLQSVLSVVAWAAYTLFLGNPYPRPEIMAVGAFVGGGALGGVLTMISALVAKAGNKTSLMAVLGLPVLLPLMLILLRYSLAASNGTWPVREMAIVLGLSAGYGVLALVLFPYLWRES